MSTAIEYQDKLKTIIETDSNMESYFESNDILTLNDIVQDDFPICIAQLRNEISKSVGRGFVSGNPIFEVECAFVITESDSVSSIRRASIPKAETLFSNIKKAKFNTQNNAVITHGIGIYNGFNVVKISMMFQGNS